MMLVFFYFIFLLGSVLSDNKFDPTKHSNWKLLNHEICGVVGMDVRIIGGKDAKIGEYPWIVRVGYHMKKDSKIAYRCGGVILNEETILSAAHCVSDLPFGVDLATISVGEHDERTDPDCEKNVCAPKMKTIRIKEVITRPDYHPQKFYNDIAIIRLENNMTFNDYVRPICLLSGSQLDENYEGSDATVAGWGIRDLNTRTTYPVLQKVTLLVRDQEFCQKTFKRFFSINPSQMCVGGQGGKDSCGGDSGGPLVLTDSVDGDPRTYLIGVVSFGMKECGKNEWPGVYTRISHFMEWILNNLKENKDTFKIVHKIRSS